MPGSQSLLFPDCSGSSAVLSDCRRYRYTLTRHVGGAHGPVNFLLLNPSIADESDNDATVKRLIGYAIAWGHSELVVTNLFSLRSTDPNGLHVEPDPVGPDNDRHVLEQAKRAALVVAGWGAHGSLNNRSVAVRRMLEGVGIALHAFGLTKGGQPMHPLYLPADRRPVPWKDLERAGGS